MQYVGIVFGGKKLVYISAFSTEKPTEVSIDSSNGILKKQPSDRWKENAIVICDGGNAWGVLYDPIKGKFFDLAVNGIG